MDNIKLRDYFAGLAMQSLIQCKISGISEPPNPAGLAKESYIYADAMMHVALTKIPPPKPSPMPFPKPNPTPNPVPESSRLRR
jgi:hypothetical protein